MGSNDPFQLTVIRVTTPQALISRHGFPSKLRKFLCDVQLTTPGERTCRAGFPSESETSGGTLIVNSGGALDRQLQRQMFAGKLRRHHQNGPEVCAGRMLAETNDVTSFHVLVLLSVRLCVLCADIQKMTDRAFAFLSPPSVYFHVRTHPHAQQTFRFEIQFLFLREAAACISSQNF